VVVLLAALADEDLVALDDHRAIRPAFARHSATLEDT
jgi:hypothetical protein